MPALREAQRDVTTGVPVEEHAVIEGDPHPALRRKDVEAVLGCEEVSARRRNRGRDVERALGRERGRLARDPVEGPRQPAVLGIRVGGDGGAHADPEDGGLPWTLY